MAGMGGKLTLGGDETAEGTRRRVNRSSLMGYHSDRPADELKLEARRFQESLRRALATPPGKPTK